MTDNLEHELDHWKFEYPDVVFPTSELHKYILWRLGVNVDKENEDCNTSSENDDTDDNHDSNGRNEGEKSDVCEKGEEYQER